MGLCSRAPFNLNVHDTHCAGGAIVLLSRELIQLFTFEGILGGSSED